MQPCYYVYGFVDRQLKPSSAWYCDDMAVFVSTLHAKVLSNAAHPLSNPILKQSGRVCVCAHN